MTNPTSTTVPVEIIPIRLVFTDGTTYDAGPFVRGAVASPLFVNGSYATGITQYGDAVMRSEWGYTASNTKYHVMLGKPVVAPTVQLTVSSANGYTKTTNGVKSGYLTFSWFLSTIEPQTIQRLGIEPTTLAIFATYNTRVLEQSGYCCYAGYHDVFRISTASGTNIWTTAWASITSSSVETLSHEIAEWFNDPFYTNRTPKWIQPVSHACGGSLLEVGDPVTTYTFNVNGYPLQDEAYYSWFARDVPSRGLNGKYDLMGKLLTPATTCT